MPPRTVPAAAVLAHAGTARGSRARRVGRLQNLPPAKRVAGIDPGLHRTGFGVVEVDPVARLRQAGVLTARAADPLPLRLQSLYEGLCQVLDEHEPEVVVIEDLFSTYAHPRSALLMAHARGVLMLAAAQRGITVCSFLPNEVKQVITGSGHASKSAVQNAVRRHLNLRDLPEPADVADALAVALCFVVRRQSAGSWRQSITSARKGK